ncbi:N-acetyltransferase [Arthrobacter sp.]|uniref:N-acetyltransferase n=2 Tax=Arthrobacter sp. TaxID=1667 RepID=UPI002811ED01|nr:N-acetyltransferase [Arthrobacter sp.]
MGVHMDLRYPDASSTNLRTAVRDNMKLSRFELYVDGENVGHLQYESRQGQIWLLHTNIEQRFKRARLDNYFIGNVLENLHRRRLAVMPFCPAVRGYLGGHPEWTTLIPASERSRFRLTPATKARKTTSRAS